MSSLPNHLLAVAACLATALLAWPLTGWVDPVNLVMLFLLTVLLDPSGTGAIVVAHTSNYRVVGFTEEPELADAWSLQGNVNLKLERKGQALASFRRALELKPDNLFLMLNIVQTLIGSGEAEAAAAESLRFLQAFPDEPTLLEKLGYVRLLRAHINKEDNVLYPMGERILTAEDQQWLAKEFDRVEAEEIGAGVHEKYHQMAHELAEG